MSLATVEGKLIVVSNRLPTTLTCSLHGDWGSKPSSGGLVSGLNGYLKGRPYLWVGSPDIKYDNKSVTKMPKAHERIVEQLLEAESRVPVFVPKETYDLFYEGYSNNVLWPFLHSVTEHVHYTEAGWDAYVQVNRAFAERTARLVQNHDVVWIQDYQLFMMAHFLKAELRRLKRADVRIGFFLHIPVPKAKLFLSHPIEHWQDWVRSVLQCDLVGFQTNIETRNFAKICVRELGAEADALTTAEDTGNQSLTLALQDEQLRIPESTKIGTYNIGITPEKFETVITGGEEHQAYLYACQELRHDFLGPKGFKHIVCGVERLDYSKGIPERIRAFHLLLQKQQQFRPRGQQSAVLIQVSVPSRSNIPAYQREKRLVDEAAQAANAEFPGSVVVIHAGVPFAWMCALYRLSTACLVTAIKDGMNLVAFEYIALQKGAHGTLVLSVEPGAAHYLDGYVPCDPHATSHLESAAVDQVKPEFMVRAAKRDPVRFSIDDLHVEPHKPVSPQFVVGPRRSKRIRIARKEQEKKAKKAYPAIADALYTALLMHTDERTENWEKAIIAVRKHTALAWATRFLNDLRSTKPKA